MNFIKTLFCGIFFFFCAGKLTAQSSKIFSLPFPSQYAALDSFFSSFVTECIYDHQIAEELLAVAAKTRDPLTILNCKRAVLGYKYVCSIENGPPSAYIPIIDEANKLLEETDGKKYPEIVCPGI